jgi:hypothetical protein
MTALTVLHEHASRRVRKARRISGVSVEEARMHEAAARHSLEMADRSLHAEIPMVWGPVTQQLLRLWTLRRVAICASAMLGVIIMYLAGLDGAESVALGFASGWAAAMISSVVPAHGTLKRCADMFLDGPDAHVTQHDMWDAVVHGRYMRRAATRILREAPGSMLSHVSLARTFQEGCGIDPEHWEIVLALSAHSETSLGKIVDGLRTLDVQHA